MTEPAEPFYANGTVLAGYAIRSLIGRGSTAYVYQAEDGNLGRIVALKVLAPDLANSEDFRRRFLQESQLAASLDHPNIIPIYDFDETDDTLYIAMRYVEGSNLRALLAQGRLIDLSYLLDVLSQVAEALDDVHAHGMVHRNLKPANILISSATAEEAHDHIYVTDFGVTRPVTAIAGADPAGPDVSTMPYLAPEQILGGTVSPRTDVYALGCIVHHCLTGSAPLAGGDDAVGRTVHVVDAPPVSQQRPDLPAAAYHVVATAMAVNPADRYADCGTFITELSEQLHRHGSVARDRPAVSHPPRRTGVTAAGSARAPGGLRRRTVLGILTGVVAVALGVGAYSALSTERFPATDSFPISFSYPSHWREAADETTVVLSPYASDMLGLFGENGGEQNWPRIGELLRSDPYDVEGLLVVVRPGDESAQSPEQQRQLIQARLPENLRFLAEQPATLGGVPAMLLDAELSQSTDPGAQLRLQCYIATDRAPGSRTVWLIFFSARTQFPYDLPTFERIARSVAFPG